MTKQLILLGSTGSIGVQTLNVARKHNIRVTALAAGSNIELIEAQAREFKPIAVALSNEKAAAELKIRLSDTDIKVYSGTEGVCSLVELPGDTVLNAIVGIAGLKASLKTVECGKTLALANKESLVTGGELVNKALNETGSRILPVDSEHSAIFQCLQGVPDGALSKIMLTASGGPFFGKTRKELENVTVADALNHPNWSMGKKITIDSATLMNKGLEVIEAVHLFGLSANDIEVTVHRESIIHSGVYLKDGAVIAQMGIPDMAIPIQYALTYPERYLCVAPPDFAALGKMTFYKPDIDTFGCLKVCIDAINAGGLKPAAANGANEEAVGLFLDGKIKFLQIAELVRGAMENQASVNTFSVDDVFACDKAAREYVLNHI